MDPISANPQFQMAQARLQQGQSQLAQLQRDYTNPTTRDQKKLKQSAQEFEAIFVQQMLDAMDKTVDREDSLMGGGTGEEYFRGMLNQEIAKSITNRPGGSGFGLAEAIYKQTAAQLKSGNSNEVKP
jgi:flagellar protein FlgJ